MRSTYSLEAGQLMDYRLNMSQRLQQCIVQRISQRISQRTIQHIPKWIYLPTLFLITSNLGWAACELETDVCLEVHTAAGAQTITAKADADVNSSYEIDNSDANANAAELTLEEDQLVSQITADLKARRLTRPPGDNALEKVLALKKINPTHDYSINGERYVARIYLSMARDDLKRDRVKRAGKRLDSAAEVYPQLNGLQAVAETIKAKYLVDQSDERVKAAGVENNATGVIENSGNKSPAGQIASLETRDLENSDLENSDLESRDLETRDLKNSDLESSNLKSSNLASEQRPAATVLIVPIMVGLPAGTFVMGSEFGAENEKPAHQVQVDAFSMSRFEVTREQYHVYKTDTGIISAPPGEDQALLPVAGVSWDEATAYTQWLSARTGKRYRLPTESEWEYAARAGSMTPYHSGDSIFGLANCLTCLDDIPRLASAVGTFEPNAFGLYDMHGNVAEWSADCISSNYFDSAEQVCTKRVVRGGSWRSTREQVRSSYRVGRSVAGRSMDIGFRVVRDGL